MAATLLLHIRGRFYSWERVVAESLQEPGDARLPAEITLLLAFLISHPSSITGKGAVRASHPTAASPPLPSPPFPPPSWAREPSLMVTGEHPPEGRTSQAGGVDEDFDGGDGEMNTGRICSVWSCGGCKINCPWWGAIMGLWWFREGGGSWDDRKIRCDGGWGGHLEMLFTCENDVCPSERLEAVKKKKNLLSVESVKTTLWISYDLVKTRHSALHGKPCCVLIQLLFSCIYSESSRFTELHRALCSAFWLAEQVSPLLLYLRVDNVTV